MIKSTCCSCRDPGSVSSTHKVVETTCNSNSRGSVAHFWFSQYSHQAHMWNTRYTCRQNTHIYKIISKKKFLVLGKVIYMLIVTVLWKMRQYWDLVASLGYIVRFWQTNPPPQKKAFIWVHRVLGRNPLLEGTQDFWAALPQIDVQYSLCSLWR